MGDFFSYFVKTGVFQQYQPFYDIGAQRSMEGV